MSWLQFADAPVARLHRVYFALKPKADAAREIVALAAMRAAAEGLNGRLTPAERLHITLSPLGAFVELDAQVLARARLAASRVRLGPFVVGLNQVLSWGRAAPYPFVLTGDEGLFGVHRLHEAIHDALRQARLAKGGVRTFAPHVILLRDRRCAGLEVIAPVRWRVSEFLLIDSLYGEGRHEVLGRWRLGDTRGPE